MKSLLKLEELSMFLLGIYLFGLLNYAWWWFPVLILLPDIVMLGYLKNEKVGSYTYNIFHHKGLAILIFLLGKLIFHSEILSLIGIILFSHAALDRIFGYGLKYEKGFKFTHLGSIGKAH